MDTIKNIFEILNKAIVFIGMPVLVLIIVYLTKTILHNRTTLQLEKEHHRLWVSFLESVDQSVYADSEHLNPDNPLEDWQWEIAMRNEEQQRKFNLWADAYIKLLAHEPRLIKEFFTEVSARMEYMPLDKQDRIMSLLFS